MKKLTQEHKDKISAAQKTRVRTEEEKKKISESLKGHEVSEETKKKIGDGNRGKKYSEATRKKMSESFKGRTHTKETREKIAEALRKKKKWSDEMINELVYLREVKELPFYKIGPMLPEPKSANACYVQYKRLKEAQEEQ